MATGTSFAPDKRLRRAEARRVPFAAGGDPWPMNPPCSWTESKLSSSSASTQKSSPSSPDNGAAAAFLMLQLSADNAGLHLFESRRCAIPLVRVPRHEPAGEVQESPRKEFLYWNDDGQLTAVRVNDWKMVFLEQRSKGRSVWREPFSATANWPTPWGMDASRRIAARVTRGAISLSSSSHFALRPYSTP